jgi:hypothetical protein
MIQSDSRSVFPVALVCRTAGALARQVAKKAFVGKTVRPSQALAGEGARGPNIRVTRQTSEV